MTAPSATANVNGTSGGDTVDLTAITQPTAVNLGGDTASVSGGLNSPNLTFIGTPDALTLGSGGSTVQYALQASSGIETISDFQFGRDVLSVDLLGAANANLRAFDTAVNNVKAIALASSADLAHGVVLLNTGAVTASNLLAAHTTFSGGHALIT